MAATDFYCSRCGEPREAPLHLQSRSVCPRCKCLSLAVNPPEGMDHHPRHQRRLEIAAAIEAQKAAPEASG